MRHNEDSVVRWFASIVIVCGVMVSVMCWAVSELSSVWKDVDTDVENLIAYSRLLGYDIDEVETMDFETFKGRYKERLYYEKKAVDYAIKVMRVIDRFNQK